MSQILIEIDKRRANRALSAEPVPAQVISRIMTAATYAPSCFNSQSWRFLVATEPEALENMRSALTEGNYWAKKAPVLIAVVTRKNLDCKHSDGGEYAFFDCGLATQNLLLQAVKEGLYAHPMAGFNPLAVKNAFTIPESFTVITLIAVGFPGSDSHLSDKHLAAEKSVRSRKAESQVIFYNSWNDTIR